MLVLFSELQYLYISSSFFNLSNFEKGVGNIGNIVDI